MTTDRPSAVATGEQPPVFGSLGQAMSEPLSPIVTIVSLVAAVIAILIAAIWLADAVIGLAPSVGYVPAIWVFGVGASILVVAAIAAMAFLPPFFLRGRDRAAFVVHSWLGARETRRALGRPARSVAIVGSPEQTARWLERTPATDALRPVRFEALVMLGRLREARSEAERFRRRTPWEEYRYLEAVALVDEQEGVPLDEAGLRDAIARIPQGVERTEAEASLAVNLARRALPHGDWRRPLVAVRPSIAESDTRILVRDFGLTTFEIIMRRIGVWILVLIAIIAVFLSLAPVLT